MAEITRDKKGRFIKGSIPHNKGLPKEMQPCYTKQNTLGYRHTEETKKKISQALAEQHKRGIRSAEQLHTKESREKASLSRMGHEVSEQTRQKIGNGNRGEKNPRWNPNREEVKQDRRNDGAYKQWRYTVRKRDRNECQLKSGECSSKIVTHHIIPWSVDKTLRYQETNGITLCSLHHPRTRESELNMVETFSRIIKLKY